MTVQDIIDILEAFAPAATQEPWDNAGLCIGSPRQEVHGVLVGFDCTKALIDEAVSCGADMVVTHHPLIFGGLKRIDPDDPVGAAVTAAVRHGVAVYAAHTNADKAEGGVNALMAARLGLEEARPLDESGLAWIGRLPRTMSGEAFAAYIKERFSLPTLRCSRPVGEVTFVGTSCGSGSSFADKAYEAGAEAFVTGDVSYHHFFVPEGRMIVDIGHYESEIDIVSKFVSVLRKKLPTFAVCTTHEKQNNPVYHF